MIPIYIKKHKESENSNFKDDIYRKLYKTLNIGDHYIPGEHMSDNTVLYWITSRITVRDLKKAIGHKIIFEHRLRFYSDIEEINPPKEDKLSKKELDLITHYRRLSSKKFNI